MLGLPKDTELRRVIPKKVFFSKFGMNTSEQKEFDSVIRQMAIVNEVSSRTIPALGNDANNKAIYVLAVQLKQYNCSDKLLKKLLSLIEQRIVLALEYKSNIQLALFHEKLIKSEFKKAEDVFVELRGMTLKDVWDSIALQLANIVAKEGQSAEDAIINSVEIEKLHREIEILTKKMWSEKQPNKKLVLRQQIKQLNRKLEELK